MIIAAIALSILLVVIFPGYYILQTAEYPRQLVHILSAAVAFSVLCVAALQAILLGMQEYLLRRQYAGGVIKRLPPLETMERLLFQVIGLGFLLLSIVLISSMYFFLHPFQPPLLPKTISTLATWGIFAILLTGRHFFGWRGRKIIYYTFSGVALLMIIYFGSQFSMENLL